MMMRGDLGQGKGKAWILLGVLEDFVVFAINHILCIPPYITSLTLLEMLSLTLTQILYA